MEIEYNTHQMYKVVYIKDRKTKIAMFESKDEAQDFAKTVNGYVNAWLWRTLIEK